MVLGAHGRRADLATLRDLTATGRDGVSAAGMVRAAGELGLAGKGVRCPAERLEDLPRGSVLHWAGNHFVVLTGVSRRGLHVLDPALGRRVVPPQTVAEQYSGVALVFAPTAAPEAPAPADASPPRWRLYRPFVRGAGRPALVALGCAAAVQAFVLVNPLVLRYVVERAGEPAARSVAALAAGLAALAAGFLVAQVGRLLFLVALQRIVDTRLTVGVLHHLAALPYAFVARRSVGDLALRIRSTAAVRELLTSSALSAVLDGTLVLGYLVVIGVIDLWFALLTTAAVALQALVVAAGWSRMRHAAADSLEAQTRSQAELFELVSGLELLKASGAAAQSVTDWSGRLRAEVAAQARSSRISGVVDAVLVTLRFGAPPALLVLGLARVQDGALALSDMLALAALSAAVTVPAGALLSTVCALTTVAGYLERLDDLMRAEPERRGGRPVPGRLRGAVELREVSYRYSALLPPAVEGISARIEPGEHVAVVGPSGSGKTTLALLVAGLHDPAAGSVLIDGVDVREYDLEQLRRRIGVVPQTTTLFQGSVRHNIRLGRAWVTDDDVVTAAEAAAIHDDIAALPAGYDTALGNSGAGLSGGQRQRLALARALAGRPGLLILDEATSALDPVTERVVHEALARLDCTRLVIAHRVATVTAADRILLLEGGRLVADGSYAALRRRNTTFRALLAADGRLRTPAARSATT
jgi:ATP-binding cassette subfamily B protein